jgi:GNAT superfamily N-acetyltransferase
VGQGLDLFRQMFAQERLYTGVLYLAALRLCLRRALEHAETRHQFGRPIGRNQYVQERVVRTRVAEELLACLLADLAPAVDRGDDVSDRLAVVKIHGIEAALEASADLMRLLGGRGMRQDEPAGKLHRDLLALSILGGTVELQKIVLYQELAKRVPAEPPRRSDVAITLHERGDLTPDLDRSLIELTARIFPDEPALRGRYYFDTPPDLVLAAWKDGQLAGFRIVVRRTVDLGSGAVRVAGLGIGVDPRFQRQGIGTELTRRALEVLRAGGDDLAVAFLFTPSAEKLLKAFGFRRLPARITFADRSTGAVREETAPAWALDLHRGTLVEDLGACGMVHLGAGAW